MESTFIVRKLQEKVRFHLVESEASNFGQSSSEQIGAAVRKQVANREYIDPMRFLRHNKVHF